MANEQNREEKRQYILSRIQEMCYFDDVFMTKCLENYSTGIELMLQIIMNDHTLVVKEAQVQSVIKNLQGRSIRMDVKATDLKKKEYDVEMQRADSGARPKRARYNSSLMDANAILPGDDTELLPETYVIFITEHDVLGKNKPLYHIGRYIFDTNEMFDDGSHILYVNGAYRGDSPIGKLMHDFSCTNPSDMYYGTLANRVRFFKESKEGIEIMCRAMEDMRNQTLKEGAINSAKRMLADGILTLEKIAEYAGLSLDEVKKLKAEQAV